MSMTVSITVSRCVSAPHLAGCAAVSSGRGTGVGLGTGSAWRLSLAG